MSESTTERDERWAADRESVVGRMGRDELRAYTIGLSHAYADVFAAFSFDLSDDMTALRGRLAAQWDAVKKARTQGVLS